MKWNVFSRSSSSNLNTDGSVLMAATKNTTLTLGEITVEVVRKDIKNVHLSVYPPMGAVRMSAPTRMNLQTLRAYAISRLPWIRQQMRKILEQERETSREYLDRETHYVWGSRYLLKLEEKETPPVVLYKHNRLVLQVRPGTPLAKKHAVMAEWYRDQLKHAVASLVEKWEPLLGVTVERFFVQHMKTRWGSCNPATGTIRLNSELAKKPPECLEYIVVHEMVHLLEPTHNQRFVALMDRYMSDWHFYRDKLNRLPVRHEDWVY
jgi:predicted metal-dependent hydrolase